MKHLNKTFINPIIISETPLVDEYRKSFKQYKHKTFSLVALFIFIPLFLLLAGCTNFEKEPIQVNRTVVDFEVKKALVPKATPVLAPEKFEIIVINEDTDFKKLKEESYIAISGNDYANLSIFLQDILSYIKEIKAIEKYNSK